VIVAPVGPGFPAVTLAAPNIAINRIQGA